MLRGLGGWRMPFSFVTCVCMYVVIQSQNKITVLLKASKWLSHDTVCFQRNNHLLSRNFGCNSLTSYLQHRFECVPFSLNEQKNMCLNQFILSCTVVCMHAYFRDRFATIKGTHWPRKRHIEAHLQIHVFPKRRNKPRRRGRHHVLHPMTSSLANCIAEVLEVLDEIFVVKL